ELYRANGRIFRENNELFAEPSWLQVMEGQRIHPRGHHPLAGIKNEAEVAAFLHNVETVIGKCVNHMPDHAEFIAANCAASR
ncbi:MAG: tryptophan 7-halogenase, partial [Xanthomonadaceae bacterium]|nr:tryptophan 7-halogenase [Xanthomonadaceae bacterium]